MIITTTNSIEGRKIVEYMGICSGEAILGANVFRDLFASVRDLVGGRANSYEKVIRAGKEVALGDMQTQATELGANAILGVALDYEVIGSKGSMMMVIASGTAVRIE